MEAEVLQTTVKRFVGCPEALRPALTAWMDGKITGEELSEASYAFALDHLQDYRRKDLPSVPDPVAQWRAQPESERRAVPEKERLAFHAKWAKFFAQESVVVEDNRSNLLWLSTLVAWAQAKGLPGSVLASIRQVLSTHQDSGEPLEA